MADPHITQATAAETICASGFVTSLKQHLSATTKQRVYARYGIRRSQRNTYVIDHLIPLEVGGSSAIENLWPQRRLDAANKDTVEKEIHGLVCSGQLELGEAQAAFRTGWTHARQIAEQAVAARKSVLGEYLASAAQAALQQQLDDYLASLPPSTTSPPLAQPTENASNDTPTIPDRQPVTVPNYPGCNPTMLPCLVAEVGTNCDANRSNYGVTPARVPIHCVNINGAYYWVYA